MLTEQQIRTSLAKVMDPELKRSIVELGMVRDVQIADGRIHLTLALTTLACPLQDKIQDDVRKAILDMDGTLGVNIHLAEMTAAERNALRQGSAPSGLAESLNDVHHVIAVMSGKGGVGKSLVSGLLAVALRRRGYKVGILDADITGPSIPKMFFSQPPRPGASPTAILPATSQTGITIMSINLLLESEDDAVIWRGPLIGGAIRQFWTEVLWGTLDYLIVDLPPGTSDASLTVLQSLPMSGVVLVTSPQQLSGMVVRKAAQMVHQLGVPILGLIENMSYFVCPDNGTEYALFGPSHAEETALKLGVSLLGRLPIDPAVATLCDSGRIEDHDVSCFSSIVDIITDTTPAARPPLMANAPQQKASK
jgi:Mrp family chromosome partitioning ATPase